ncbi:hypothetical protein M2651_05855 [Clostridium sp. SYSU_GA19001]|uniref:hypothetical protein n=1 Tax=Clostridium caldaquaticum TaxID=2940653 RepID=UPI0020770ADA|nr:hypothetical protein [Clostridium caldaquaticum]MCM8710550.1 hypothetical protein [Clostridium caldaquaticum]
MMKKLFFDNEVLEAEKIIKYENKIIGYIGDNEVFSFKGITDFSVFTLEEGQEFDINKTEELEILKKENVEIKLAIAEMYETILGGI